jgi:hypothetical protein
LTSGEVTTRRGRRRSPVDAGVGLPLGMQQRKRGREVAGDVTSALWLQRPSGLASVFHADEDELFPPARTRVAVAPVGRSRAPASRSSRALLVPASLSTPSPHSRAAPGTSSYSP